jgi:acylphosphatase
MINMTNMNTTAKHIIFIGRVQGVGFRFTVFNIANRYQLTGLVRNLTGGSVEMIAQGFSEDIDDCIQDIFESFAGHISQTKIEDIPSNPQYTDFKITF